MESINKNGDFTRLYKKGKQAVNSGLVIYVLPTKKNKLRLGITASKKIGNAVKRNRAKRVIRAAFNEVKKDVNGSYDIVLVARAKTTFLKSTDVYKVMQKEFSRLGLLV